MNNKIFSKLLSLFFVVLCSFAFSQSKFKCLLQMKNYTGEGAYITVYIVSPQGDFIKTLNVMGDDKKWYNTLKRWYPAQRKKKENLDGITGASVSGGKRNIVTIEIDDSLLNKGNKLRFESAVEDGDYVPVEAEIILDAEHIEKKVDGKGYVRFVKLNKI